MTLGELLKHMALIEGLRFALVPSAPAPQGPYNRRVDHHLAQVNVSRLLAPLDSRVLADFMAALDEVNAEADRAPGFVWRLQTEDGNATSVQAFGWDVAGSHGVIVNLTVWRDVESLAGYVFGGHHVAHHAASA